MNGGTNEKHDHCVSKKVKGDSRLSRSINSCCWSLIWIQVILVFIHDASLTPGILQLSLKLFLKWRCLVTTKEDIQNNFYLWKLLQILLLFTVITFNGFAWFKGACFTGDDFIFFLILGVIFFVDNYTCFRRKSNHIQSNLRCMPPRCWLTSVKSCKGLVYSIVGV